MGPTGSGKLTAMVAALGRVASPQKVSVLLDDTPGIHLPCVNRISTHLPVPAPQTPETRVGAVLEGQNPDVIAVDEIRGAAMATILLQNGASGRLALGTLHSENGVYAIERLIAWGNSPVAVAQGLAGVIASRLVRRAHKECLEVGSPSPQQLEELGIRAEEARAIQWVRGKGCPECYGTGYRGRLVLFELLELGPERTRALMTGGLDALQRSIEETGFKSLRQTAIEAVIRGETTVEEALRVLGPARLDHAK